jgi:hypothetical protein
MGEGSKHGYLMSGIKPPIFLQCLKAFMLRGSMKISIADLKRLNEILELEQDSFFEHYKQLKIFYDYLAQTYHYDSKTHTVNPATGEIVKTRSDNTYFDKMTK